MRTHRLWAGCGIVFASLVLASCTQGQIEQVLQNKTQNMISGPCPPGSGPVSATPEFCLYVTELRLINQDTQADVSITIVNRTSRRLYLAASSWPYLIDSRGVRWSMGKNTGINSWGYPPLSVEPNVEAQISFIFGRGSQSQAPADVTFSMRGEFAIAGVDSYGEPILAGPPKTSRGFSIAGIRLVQQPPPSSSALQQNTDSTVAQLAPLDVGLAAPRTDKPDILGIRLGMSPDEAKLILKKQGFSLQPDHVSEATIEGLPNSRHIASMATSSTPLGSMLLYFSAPPTPSGVIRLDRSVQYDKGASGAPSEDNLLKALNDKFGDPMLRFDGSNWRYWIWTADGKPAPTSIRERCRQMSPSPTTFDPNVQKMVDEGCGWVLGVTYAAQGGVVTSTLQIMVDVAGAATASKATVQAAREKNLDRANKQKPAL